MPPSDLPAPSAAGTGVVTQHSDHAPPISIERARFALEMQRLRALREEQPPERGVDPMTTSPDLVHGVAAATRIWSIKRVAEALGMGKSTVHEWVSRAARDSARARLTAEPGTHHDDQEVAAIYRCIAALDAVDRDARQRVLNYIDERYFGRAKGRP